MRPTPRVPRRHTRRLKSPKALRRENRADRSGRHGAMSLAIHHPTPGRSSVAGARSARSECRKPAEPGARSSRPITYGTSGTAPWRGARKARPGGRLSRNTTVARRRRPSRRCDPSPASGSGLPLAGVVRREGRTTPPGTAWIGHARRGFPRRKDVSATCTERPQGQSGTRMLSTPPTLSRNTRFTRHYLCRK